MLPAVAHASWARPARARCYVPRVLEAKRSTDPDDERHVDEEKERAAPPRRRRIRCPKCQWEPKETDVWSCVCFCAWNTFLTAGICPACGRHWAQTQCHHCGEWSPHLAWYDDEPGKDA
jgi:hypothetical protein